MSRVIVVGSVSMDIVVTATRYPGPGETVLASDIRVYPGGKGANQAVAAAKLGSQCILVGKVGADAFGRELTGFLKQHGVGLDYLRMDDQAPTETVLIIRSCAGNATVLIPGANARVGADDLSAVRIEPADIVVNQFGVPLDTVYATLRRARVVGARSILNPSPALVCPSELLEMADVLVVNAKELAFLLKEEAQVFSLPPRALEGARRLRSAVEQVVVVTLGARGVVCVAGEREFEIPARFVSAVDTIGAGDCFVGALAHGYASGKSLEKALEEANLAASICVGRPGAAPSMPTAAEISIVLSQGPTE